MGRSSHLGPQPQYRQPIERVAYAQRRSRLLWTLRSLQYCLLTRLIPSLAFLLSLIGMKELKAPILAMRAVSSEGALLHQGDTACCKTWNRHTPSELCTSEGCCQQPSEEDAPACSLARKRRPSMRASDLCVCACGTTGMILRRNKSVQMKVALRRSRVEKHRTRAGLHHRGWGAANPNEPAAFCCCNPGGTETGTGWIPSEPGLSYLR